MSELKEKVSKAKKKAADAVTAEAIEGKKTVRSTARKVKNTVEKAAAPAAEKLEEIKLAAEIETGKAKARTTRKKAEAKEKLEDAKKAVRKPAAKRAAAKLNINIQSQMGGSITLEEIVAKIPKEATDIYVKAEENKIYWVSPETIGSVDIWG
ncbi:MAG: hypothetical protein J6U01_11610 [Clostridia bacterium]|nr:hypothetical protein [Clostridia bacterium]